MRHLVALSLLAAGCAAGQSVALVTVDGNAHGVTAFAVTVTLDGKASQTATITPAGAPRDLPPPVRLALTFAPDAQGTATVHVEAMGAQGVVARGDSAPFTLTPSQESDVSVTLGGGAEPDLGVSDFAPPPDVAMPDLAAPDAAAPDAATAEAGAHACVVGQDTFGDGCTLQ